MTKMDRVFNYIKPNDNIKLSDLKNDLCDYLVLINDYNLELRTSLDLNSNITIGLELEFENARVQKIKKYLKEHDLIDEWIVKSDGTLEDGAEINSPILKDFRSNWLTLKEVCDIVNSNAVIGTNAGSHIHFGAQILDSKTETWNNLLLLWSTYEEIIFRFGYGEYLAHRPNINSYAKNMKNDFIRIMENKKNVQSLISLVCKEKYNAINFSNVKNYDNFSKQNTIEIRCPNGTLNPIVWQNNVNFFAKLLLYCKSPNFNRDLIESRLEKTRNISFKFYNEIFVDEALELCDLIFSNNIDKIYFLRQYLKAFEISGRKIEKAKKFTK